MIYLNARAIIERQTEDGIEVVIQTRSRRHRGIKLNLWICHCE